MKFVYFFVGLLMAQISWAQSSLQTIPMPVITFHEVEGSGVLDTILARHADKTIYLDFWGTWCMPCLAEMAIFPHLNQHFKDQAVDFVFLAVDSPKEEWRKTIEARRVEGDHYLLTETQYQQLAKKLGIISIPHHVLIGPDGTIAATPAPVPCKEGVSKPEINEKLVTLIKKIVGRNAK